MAQFSGLAPLIHLIHRRAGDVTRDRARPQWRRFLADRRGNYAVMSAVLFPIAIGGAGLGLDFGVWFNAKRSMQGAADSAAMSAAVAYAVNSGANLTTQGQAVTAAYGYVANTDGVTVAVNRPATLGAYAGRTNAIEVIMQKSEPPMFSSVLGVQQMTVGARAVALSYGGAACVLALDPTASAAISGQGNTTVALNNCSIFSDSANATSISVGGSASVSALSAGAVGGISGAITTTYGVNSGQSPLPDPYAATNFPSFSGCTANNYTAKTTVTLNPGVYCGGIKLNANANVTLNPGLYYMDQGSLDVNGGAVLTGDGVTIIFTSSTGQNYATASINGGATVTLTAPTTGSTAGIVLFGDRNMPTGTTFKLNGGAAQSLGGATYLPKAAVDYTGSNAASNQCAQLIGDTIAYSGNSNFSVSCPGMPIAPVASSLAKLVE